MSLLGYNDFCKKESSILYINCYNARKILNYPQQIEKSNLINYITINFNIINQLYKDFSSIIYRDILVNGIKIHLDLIYQKILSITQFYNIQNNLSIGKKFKEWYELKMNNLIINKEFLGDISTNIKTLIENIENIENNLLDIKFLVFDFDEININYGKLQYIGFIKYIDKDKNIYFTYSDYKYSYKNAVLKMSEMYITDNFCNSTQSITMPLQIIVDNNIKLDTGTFADSNENIFSTNCKVLINCANAIILKESLHNLLNSATPVSTTDISLNLDVYIISRPLNTNKIFYTKGKLIEIKNYQKFIIKYDRYIYNKIRDTTFEFDTGALCIMNSKNSKQQDTNCDINTSIVNNSNKQDNSNLIKSNIFPLFTKSTSSDAPNRSNEMRYAGSIEKFG